MDVWYNENTLLTVNGISNQSINSFIQKMKGR